MLEENSAIQNRYCCIPCDKRYTNKSSYMKHKLLCDFRSKTKREQNIDYEESGDIPTYSELVKIVHELSFKMMKMEEKMADMQKWVDKKKKKINVITWLNTHIIPTISFLEWVNISLTVIPNHFNILMENNLYYTIQKIFEDNLCSKTDFIYPICCFSQKVGIFYIGRKNEDGTSDWKQLELSDMSLILKTIQKHMIRELTKWKIDNQHLFDENSKLSDIFNKAVIKLMDVPFTQCNSMSRIKNSLFNYLKTDLKNNVEYEFE